MTGKPQPIIEVPLEQIEIAKRNDSSHCMIADAIKVAMPHVRSVSVDLATIRYTNPQTGKRYLFLTPSVCQRALLQFDNADPELVPFAFRLPKPAQIVSTVKKKKKMASQGLRTPKASLVATHGKSAADVPTKVEGKLPPIGALAGGDGIPHVPFEEATARTGKVRRHGMKGMAR